MTIKNGDLPAMPNDIDSQTLSCLGLMPTVQAFYKHSAGLTKREYFAALAMNGLLAGVDGDSSLHDSAPEWIKNMAEASVEFSDALLAELERTK